MMSQKTVARFNILIILGTIFVLLLVADSVLALEKEDATFIKKLALRQERFKTNGICVSRPVPLDEKILGILSVNNIVSFEDYSRWLKHNIQYKKDEKEDHWSTPEETLKNKYADCEDYAFFNQAVLRLLGHQAQVLAIGGLGFRHALCAFEEHGRYYWMDNTELKRTEAESILEFAQYLFNKYGACYILSLNLETKDWDILFRKSEISGALANKE